MPVLTTNGGLSLWHFTVTDDFPTYWYLYESTDGGATYTAVDNPTYGASSGYVGSPGNWYKGLRADAGDVPYGPDSNIIVG